MKKIFFALMLFFAGLAAQAQFYNQPAAVRWSAEVEMSKDNSRAGVITVIAEIPEGWHIYGMQPSEYYMPTSFDFSCSSEAVKYTSEVSPSSEPLIVHDAMMEEDVPSWEGKVTFTRSFVVPQDATEAIICCDVTFMGCNDECCTPPQTKNLKLILNF